MRRWLVTLLLSGCSAHGLPPHGDGGSTVAASHCSDHTDAASCSADAACVIAGCDNCGGQTTFVECYGKGATRPTLLCPTCLADCSTYRDDILCAADSRCAVCKSCGGPFQSCYDKSTPTACGDCIPCDALTSEVSCAARADCHAVYSDASSCGAGGCCTQFKACVAEIWATCYGATCKVPPPPCQAACGYVPAVVNGCWGGCVKANECEPPI
jgi:hypothetical protein